MAAVQACSPKLSLRISEVGGQGTGPTLQSSIGTKVNKGSISCCSLSRANGNCQEQRRPSYSYGPHNAGKFRLPHHRRKW